VRPHSHPHEQLGYVLEGEITMTVAGVTDTWHAGVAYAIPGGVEHAAVAGPGGCRVIDVFIPVREEYRDKLVAAGR
jgi:quercetin dioxygenase-like cupin family protein